MLQDISSAYGVPLFVLFTLISSVFFGTWWLSNKFLEIRELIYTQTENLKSVLIKKMEYHEQHDDARFVAMSNDIWAIKLRNAAKDGYTILEQLPEQQTIARKKDKRD